MDHIFVHKIVLKVIGKHIKNYMPKRVCSIYYYFYYPENSGSPNASIENYNPWPGFQFTGKLRPYPQVRDYGLKGMCKENCFVIGRSSICSTNYSTT